MKTIINASTVTDYSGEPPVVTLSNTVTTVIRQTTPVPVITRIYYHPCCNCCGCCGCGCNCQCNLCDGCGCNCCNNFW